MSDDNQSQSIRYSYKPSLAGAPHAFTLTEQGLSFQAGFRSGVWRYDEIARFRLSYRPVSMLAHRFRADVTNKQGKSLTIISATWAGLISLKPQDDSYRAFVDELHRRVAGHNAGVICLAGLGPIAFAIGLVLFGVVMVALAGLLIRALATEAYIAALFMLGFAAWFGWHTGGWLIRNKPRRYSVADVPRALLP
jgi:hypothetical protein